MYIAIATPKCSAWTEPICGPFDTVVSTVLSFYHAPDTVIISGNDLILSWEDPDVEDEKWWIGEV